MSKYMLVALLALSSYTLHAQEYYTAGKDDRMELTEAGASHFAALALDCLQQEYPNKLNQVLPDSSMLQSPRALHPAFYGCFDWHSSVHGHWMLVRLLKQFPNLPEAELIRQKLAENLSLPNIMGEVAYLDQAGKSWERMYGWAWLLKLAEELHTWPDEQGQEWSRNLQPLADAFQKRYEEFLPIQKYPVRTGVHPNTAFGLSFAWDYALATNDQDFQNLLQVTAKRYYSRDRNCPINWEPSGEDFLSACMEEANLMRRVLSPSEFSTWMDRFLPQDLLASILRPVDVSDRSDPKIVHLDGLNLSRAWCIYGIVDGLQNEQLKQSLLGAAQRHLSVTIPHIASDHYEGTHWLASFAVFALSMNR